MSEHELERLLHDLSGLMEEMRDKVRSRGGENPTSDTMWTPVLGAREVAGASAQATCL